MPEKTCENLLTKLEKEIPEAGDDCPYRKTELALAFAAAIKPDFTDVQAAGCINAALMADNPDVYSDLYVDSDALGDVVTATEAKALAEYAAGIQSIQAQKELVLEARDNILHTYFAKPAPKMHSRTEEATAVVARKDEKNTDAITRWILTHTPESVTIECDNYNGRWRVVSLTLEWKSISWTKRGCEKAALEVVHQAWVFHKDCLSEQAPFDLEELQQRFQEDVIIC